MPTSPDDLLTAQQAGSLRGCSYRTILRMADSGRLPVAHKLPSTNGAYLFRRADVESLAAEPKAATA